MIRRPPRSTLFPTRRSSDLRARRRSKARSPTRRTAVSRRTAAGTRYRRSDRKSTRLNSSHLVISYAVFCLKKKKKKRQKNKKQRYEIYHDTRVQDELRQ